MVMIGHGVCIDIGYIDIGYMDMVMIGHGYEV